MTVTREERTGTPGVVLVYLACEQRHKVHHYVDV
jgi:hypothetical protein